MTVAGPSGTATGAICTSCVQTASTTGIADSFGQAFNYLSTFWWVPLILIGVVILVVVFA